MKKVRGKFYERYQILFLGHLDDVVDDAIQNVVWKSAWSESVVLGRFDNLSMVLHHRLDFFSITSVTLKEDQMLDSKRSAKRLLFDPVFLPSGVNVFCVNVPRPVPDGSFLSKC